MPPKAQAAAGFSKDEKVLCFHGDLLYEAKILNSKPKDPTEKDSEILYQVHYKGWKNTWDDWVGTGRIRKFTEENKELARNLKKDLDALKKPLVTKTAAGKRKALGSAENSSRNSEERQASLPATGRGKRGKDQALDNEEFFYQRPEIRIPLPDQLKSILVDDWENVTRSMQLVHLPSRNPANTIIDTYWEEEKTKRRGGSPEFDLLAETMQGLKEYFDIALGKVLLYRLERPQYKEVYEQLENPAGTEYDGKKIGDIYGGEHLLRLLVQMPRLITQTNMDIHSVRVLREEISRFALWLARHTNQYFLNEYEAADKEYVDEVRSGKV